MKWFDPKHDDFDPYSCWEDANCDYVDEACYGDPDDDDFEEVLFCSAPYDYACPLHEVKIKKIKK